jgi:hypothetical protein
METELAGWRRSASITGLRSKFPAKREKYREIYRNRPTYSNELPC